MRVFLTGVLAACFVISFPGFARAEPQMEVHLKPTQAAQAEEICHFIVQLTWRSREGDYRFSRPELILDNLTVEAAGESNETFQKDGEEWKRKFFRFDLKPIRAGKAEIRPFRIVYVESAQQVNGHFEVEALELKVFPNFAKLYRVGLIITALLAVGAAIGSWLLLMQRRKQRETPPAEEATLEGRTLSRLDRNRQQLLEAVKIFRAYLSEKYSLSERASTGREILLGMENRASSDELKTLKRIFDTLDEWQYSASPRSREECERLHHEMVRYVEGKKVI